MPVLLGQVMCKHSGMDKDLNMGKLLAEHPAMESFAAAKSTNVKIGYGVVEGHVKRIFDVICASVGLVVLSPAFLLVAILIKLDSKGPVFFRHERVGQYEKLFRIHKFRSMVVKQESSGLYHITVANDPRITRMGHWLRKWKIDELPQLIDVLYGRMSLVGPRPLVAEQVQHFPDQDKRIIFSVKPGITDLASINFRDESRLYGSRENCEHIFKNKILPEKRRLQVEYIQNQSFWLDLKIALKTISAILFK